MARRPSSRRRPVRSALKRIGQVATRRRLPKRTVRRAQEGKTSSQSRMSAPPFFPEKPTSHTDVTKSISKKGKNIVSDKTSKKLKVRSGKRIWRRKTVVADSEGRVIAKGSSKRSAVRLGTGTRITTREQKTKRYKKGRLFPITRTRSKHVKVAKRG